MLPWLHEFCIKNIVYIDQFDGETIERWQFNYCLFQFFILYSLFHWHWWILCIYVVYHMMLVILSMAIYYFSTIWWCFSYHWCVSYLYLNFQPKLSISYIYDAKQELLLPHDNKKNRIIFSYLKTKRLSYFLFHWRDAARFSDPRAFWGKFTFSKKVYFIPLFVFRNGLYIYYVLQMKQDLDKVHNIANDNAEKHSWDFKKLLL